MEFFALTLLALMLAAIAWTYYNMLALLGVDLVYALRLLFSKELRAKRRALKAFLGMLVDERLALVANSMKLPVPSEKPRVILLLRTYDNPGGRYFHKLRVILLDAPRSHEISDPYFLKALDHELVHFMQDFYGLPLDEEQAERVARATAGLAQSTR